LSRGSPSGGLLAGPVVVAGPDAKQLTRAFSGTTVHGCFDQREDSALQSGGQKYLAPSSLRVRSFGCFFFSGGKCQTFLKIAPARIPLSTLMSRLSGL
jgi:hypothetical protein